MGPALAVVYLEIGFVMSKSMLEAESGWHHLASARRNSPAWCSRPVIFRSVLISGTTRTTIHTDRSFSQRPFWPEMVGLTQMFPKVLIKALTTSKRVHVMLLCLFALCCHAQWDLTRMTFIAVASAANFLVGPYGPVISPPSRNRRQNHGNGRWRWILLLNIDYYIIWQKSCFREEKGRFIWGEHSHGGGSWMRGTTHVPLHKPACQSSHPRSCHGLQKKYNKIKNYKSCCLEPRNISQQLLCISRCEVLLILST